MRLFTCFVILLIPQLGSAAGIENAVCEQIAPDRYRIQFVASDPGPIRIYASSSPDRIDSDNPAATVRQGPAEISTPRHSGRVYFHLKPASGPVRVVSVRRLPLEGAINFRDLGGYRTAAGKYVRWGRVYRSNQLSALTARDYEYLGTLGIRVVCDLRTDYERKRMPTNWKGNAPEFLIAPVSDDRSISTTMQQLKRAIETGERPEPDRGSFGYSDLFFQYSGEFTKVFRRVANSDTAVLTHCTGGADRTGIYSAILLTALGVPRDTVIADYMLTKAIFSEENNAAKLAGDMQKMIGLERMPDPMIFRGMMEGMSPDQMQKMFAAIEGKYGSFENFLQQGLGLSAAEIRLLRDRLLEP